MHYQLEYQLSTFPPLLMDSCSLSLHSVELPTVLAISSTRTPNLVIINYNYSSIRFYFFVAKHQSVSETQYVGKLGSQSK